VNFQRIIDPLHKRSSDLARVVPSYPSPPTWKITSRPMSAICSAQQQPVTKHIR